MILEATDISKKYGEYYLFREINLTLNRGDVFGLLGASGSGKTTLLRLLAGIQPPKSGNVLVDAKKINAKTKHHIVYIPDSIILNQTMKLSAHIEMLRECYHDYNWKRVERLLDSVQIDKKMRLMELSKNQQRLAQFILLICRSASFYLLDNPMDHFDIKTRQFVLQVLQESKSESAAMMMTSELLDEISPILNGVVWLQSNKATKIEGEAWHDMMQSQSLTTFYLNGGIVESVSVASTEEVAQTQEEAAHV